MTAAVESGRRRRLARSLAAATAAYTLVLVFATHYPRPEELLGPNPPSDKTLHFVAYGLLGLFVAATLAAAGRWSWARAGLLLVVLAVFAVLDEVTQPLFGRHAEPVDWIYDLIGIAAGIALAGIGRHLTRGPDGERGI